MYGTVRKRVLLQGVGPCGSRVRDRREGTGLRSEEFVVRFSKEAVLEPSPEGTGFLLGDGGEGWF